MIHKTLLLASVLLLGACTFQDLKDEDKSQQIKCFSGILKIYDGESEGSVSTGSNDRYFFTEKESADKISVSGNCIIKDI